MGGVNWNYNIQTQSQKMFTSATAFSTGGWYQAASVPEPTSGLLMLVGFGALALRRRKA